MYANLRVTIGEGDSAEVVFAWKVQSYTDDDTGLGLLIDVDKQNGTGSHAEPAGTRYVSLSETDVRIEAEY